MYVLKDETPLARSIGERLHLPAIAIARAVKDNGGNTGRLCFLRNCRANRSCLYRLWSFELAAVRRGNRLPRRIIDELRRNESVAPENREPRPLGSSCDTRAYARVSALAQLFVGGE